MIGFIFQKPIILMRILGILSLMFLLGACTLGDRSDSQKDPSKEWTEKTTQKDVAWESTLVSLNYTLREGSPEGKILETTREDVARANGLYSSGGRYQPFEVMLGTQSVIPGFEKGLMGMKKWEKKVIEVSPELGYGTGPTLQTIPKYQIAPVFTIVQDKKAFDNSIIQTVERANLPESMRNAQVGETLTGSNWATAKVTKADTQSVTLAIENIDNPFYKKKVVVGATWESRDGEATFKITKISGTGITLEVTNKKSPFYNKKFEIGESIEAPQGKIVISKINEDSVEIGQEHPLMGKTLYFDVEITDIQ